MHNCIESIKVNYDVLSSDHFPISVCVKVGGIRAEHVDTSNVHLSRCNWSKAEDVALTRYKDCCESLLSCVHIPVGAVTCCDPMCTDAQHIDAIDNMYRHVINCMKNASTLNIPQCGISNAHGSCIPGWNDYVKDSHDEARACFLLWVTHGKPRHGDIFMNIKNSRARFKYVLRICQRNEVQLRADTLASHLMHKNHATFWKDFGRNSCTNTRLTEMWRTYYNNLFSSIKSYRHKNEIVGKIANCGVDCDLITCDEVSKAISGISIGKASGNDAIFAEHLRYAGNRISVLLSMCFNAFITHGYLSRAMINTILAPVVKCKSGDLSGRNNYRPIALASVVSKVFELMLLNRCEQFLHSADNQFGFKSGLSTDLCIFTLCIYTTFSYVLWMRPRLLTWLITGHYLRS